MNEKIQSDTASRIWRIGITGGIGSGKSYVCHCLEKAGHHVFYCDDEAKRIIRTDSTVRGELSNLIGPELYTPDGQLVKKVLAAWLCRGKSYAKQVDAIVHPRVAHAFLKCAQRMATSQAGIVPPLRGTLPRTVSIHQLCELPVNNTLFMECALLFESGFDQFVDLSVLVHVSETTQLERLIKRDNISMGKAREWIALQFSEEERMRRADVVLPNDERLQ